MCCRGGGGSSLRRGLDHGFGRRVREDGPDELVAAPADGPDVALRFAVVAERAAGRLDAAGQCRLTDEASTPHGVEQLLLGHEPVMVADQLGQHVEHLGLDTDHLAVRAQLVALGVQYESVEPPHAGRSGQSVEPGC